MAERDLVFLSYAHDDLEMVREIYTGLKERKVNIWFDKEDLPYGQKWKTYILNLIPKCSHFIFCVSNSISLIAWEFFTKNICFLHLKLSIINVSITSSSVLQKSTFLI